jgi:hypothetical protein
MVSLRAPSAPDLTGLSRVLVHGGMEPERLRALRLRQRVFARFSHHEHQEVNYTLSKGFRTAVFTAAGVASGSPEPPIVIQVHARVTDKTHE